MSQTNICMKGRWMGPAGEKEILPFHSLFVKGTSSQTPTAEINYFFLMLKRSKRRISVFICVSGTIGSKILFAPKGGRFCGKNFLRYLDLYYVNCDYPKLKKLSTITGCELTNQKLQEIIFAKFSAFVVMNIWLPLVKMCHNIFHLNCSHYWLNYNCPT